MTSRNRDHGVTGRQSSGAAGGSFHETPQASNGGIALAVRPSERADVIEAFGRTPTPQEAEILDILLDPRNSDGPDSFEVLTDFGDSGADGDQAVGFILMEHYRRRDTRLYGRGMWPFSFNWHLGSDGAVYSGSVSTLIPGTEGSYWSTDVSVEDLATARVPDLRASVIKAERQMEVYEANLAAMRQRHLFWS